MAKLELDSIEAKQGIILLSKAVKTLVRDMKPLVSVLAQLDAKFKRTEVKALSKDLKNQEKVISKLTRKIDQQGKALTKLANANKKAATATKTAIKSTNTLKNASASAKQQFLGMAQSLKLAGAESIRISNLKRSFIGLEKEFKKGRVTVTQYTNRMNRFKAAMGTARREVKRLSTEERKQANAAKAATAATRRLTPTLRRLATRTRKTEKRVSGLSNRLKILGSSAIFAVGPLSGIGARVAAFGAITSKAGIAVAATAVVVATLIISIVKLIKAMVTVNVEMTKIKNALRVATGSAKNAELEFAFLVKTSKELSLNLPEVSLEFAQLSAAATGTTLVSSGVRDIFVAMSKAALVLSLSAEQTKGAFKALQQMISKGTVQAEELRGQLGERLPGAFQIAARAMDVTTRELGKLMEQGLIRATELIPKMTDELNKMFDPAVLDATNSFTAATNRLASAWFLFLDTLDTKVQSSKALQFFIVLMTDAIEDATREMTGQNSLNTQLHKVGKTIEEVTAKLKPLEAAFASNSGATGKFTTAMKGRLGVLRGQLAEALAMQKLLLKSDTSGAVQTVNKPPLTNQEFLDLPVTSVNRLQDSFSDLTNIMKVLSDESVSLEKRLDMRDALNRTQAAAKAVNKIMKALSNNEEFALRLQFTPAGKGVLTLKQLREVLLKLIIDEKDLQNSVKDATQELNRQAKAAGRLGTKFEELKLGLETVKNSMEAAFDDDFVKTQFVQSLDVARKMLLKFSDESIAIFARSSGLVSNKTFDDFISSEGLARTEAFAKILAVVEQEFGSIIRATDDAELMARVFADTRTEAELFITEMEKLEHLLVVYAEFPEKIEAINRAMANMNPVLVAISDGIKQMGSDLASGIREGKNLVDVLINSFGNLLERLLELAIQLLIIGPLLQALKLPGGSSGPAEILGFATNLFGLPSKKGNIFQGGGVTPFRQGGVVNQPSNFGFNGGIGSIAEDGPEGILPLKRGTSGKLGVEASGMGAPTVIFQLAPGMSVREFNDAQPQIAATIAGTMAAASASNN